MRSGSRWVAGTQASKSQFKELSRLDRVNATKNRGRSIQPRIGMHEVATVVMVLSFLAIVFVL